MKKNKEIYKANLNLKNEILMTRAGIILTLAASILVFKDIFGIFAGARAARHTKLMIEQIAFGGIVLSLIYGNILYQLTRIGYFKRLLKHKAVSAYKTDTFYDKPSPSLTVLIPSYKEETKIVEQTLLSAALQSYPNRRVVLLIDDPPSPQNPADLAGIIAARRLPAQIMEKLRPLSEIFQNAEEAFKQRKPGVIDNEDEQRLLIDLYRKALEWFEGQAADYEMENHTDRLFVEITFNKRAEECRMRIANLEAGFLPWESLLSIKEIEREYNRLASMFRLNICSFERKSYVNLSHEPNKAMNLNSYIGLMGKKFEEIDRKDSVHLEISNSPHASEFKDSDYLITLDADSLLDPDYALRLLYFMEQPANSRYAVIQTPYSAIPDADGVIERVAGATTDMQYLIHQGFTHYDATYWVGANAVIRKKALDDIKATETERGFTITKYIQDRTVIEDTESSIDLVYHGWKLYNFPERLSYSATPPDFGSLLIQRRRWANGGLIILPKLIRYFFRSLGKSNPVKKLGEGFMRFHYLTSLTAVNFGILFLLLYPFEQNMRCVWMPVTAVPYYFFYGRDLLLTGYTLTDLFRVYVMNLFLIPVNLGGVLKSMQQFVSGKKIPFSRTPKVQGKTMAPSFYVIIEILMLLYCSLGVVFDFIDGHVLHCFFSLTSALCFLYAAVKFMGWDEIIYAFSPKKKNQETKSPLPIEPTLAARLPSRV